MEDNNIVEINHVYFFYDEVPVLQDVNITIKERDFLAIIGPNGGGKTTILKIMLGLLEPDKGTVRLFGRAPKQARRYVGYLPQQFTFDYDFPISVMEVVLMGRLGKRGVGKKYTDEDVTVCLNALEKVGMANYKESEIGNLSGGQRQRVLIARALTSEPRLLLLDEPVSSVDTQWQKSFYELLNELNKDIAVIVVTHDVGVISTYFDKIACVNRKLYYHGSKKEGMRKISELYECPVQLITHESSDHSLEEQSDD